MHNPQDFASSLPPRHRRDCVAWSTGSCPLLPPRTLTRTESPRPASASPSPSWPATPALFWSSSAPRPGPTKPLRSCSSACSGWGRSCCWGGWKTCGQGRRRRWRRHRTMLLRRMRPRCVWRSMQGWCPWLVVCHCQVLQSCPLSVMASPSATHGICIDAAAVHDLAGSIVCFEGPKDTFVVGQPYRVRMQHWGKAAAFNPHVGSDHILLLVPRFICVPQLTKEEATLDFSQSAKQLHSQVRVHLRPRAHVHTSACMCVPDGTACAHASM